MFSVRYSTVNIMGTAAYTYSSYLVLHREENWTWMSLSLTINHYTWQLNCFEAYRLFMYG